MCAFISGDHMVLCLFLRFDEGFLGDDSMDGAMARLGDQLSAERIASVGPSHQQPSVALDVQYRQLGQSVCSCDGFIVRYLRLVIFPFSVALPDNSVEVVDSDGEGDAETSSFRCRLTLDRSCELPFWAAVMRDG